MTPTLHDIHIELVRAVNEATTEEGHRIRETMLQGWRKGVTDAGGCVDLCAADSYYLDQGIDRPMCCGVWLDWTPTPHAQGRS
jgi:hypothetical protein